MRQISLDGLIDGSSPVFYYQQLEVMLRKEVSAFIQSRQAKFYSEQEIYEKYGVSLITVKKALQQLIVGGCSSAPTVKARSCVFVNVRRLKPPGFTRYFVIIPRFRIASAARSLRE